MKKNEFAVIQLHHQFPPINSPGVLRNYFIAKTFQKLFKDHLVLTGKSRVLAVDFEVKAMAEGLNIQRIPYFDLRAVLKRFSGNKRLTINDRLKENRLARWFLKLRNAYPFVLCFADGGPLYIYRMLKAARKYIRKHPQTIIYSSFPPYADHYIAYRLTRQFPSLIWIADFRDLHVEPIYKTVLFPKYQIKRNTRMLAHANLITGVSRGISAQLKKYNRPVQLLYNGLRAPAGNGIVQFNKFTIVYTGSLYENYRDPAPLLETLKRMLEQYPERKENLQLIYAGRHGSAFSDLMVKYNLGQIFVNMGMLKRVKALELQQKAHVNLLLSSSSKEHYGILTGKFYEYLAACNPILLLVNGPEDKEFEQIFSDLETGYIHDHGKSAEALYKYIETLFNAWESNRFNQHQWTSERIVDYFSWEKELDRALKKLGFDD